MANEKRSPPTADSLRQAIDSGRTGEKADWPDPAAAPLGTDDEAAGNPPSRQELGMETLETPIQTRLNGSLMAAALYASIALAILIVLALIVYNAL